MGVDQNIVAGVLLEMTLRPPLRFLALFRVFIVFHYIDQNMYLRIDCRKKLLNSRGCSLIQYAVQHRLF